MDSELLIKWMTHRGSGRWDAFKDVVELVYGDEDRPPSPHAITDVLSMLGIAEFFIDETSRWRVFLPTIGGLSDGHGILTGGRTPTLTDRIEPACSAEGVSVTIETLQWGIRQYRLSAPSDEHLKRVADRMGLSFVPHVAEAVCRMAQPISELIENAPSVSAPHNWSVESYDFEKFAWVPGDMGATAKKFTPSRGLKRWMVQRQDGSLVELERRVAVYAATQCHTVPLVEYVPGTLELSVPWTAALPTRLARAAVLCEGTLPQHGRGLIVFKGVRWSVAAMLLALAGQPLPVASPVRTGAKP